MVTEESILRELSKLNVTEVKRIFVTRDGKREPTHTYILTFQSSSLPSDIKVGYLKVPVDAYIPNPMRCFKCQQFGHHRDNCRSSDTCSKCGEKDHSRENCANVPMCVNCKGRHDAGSRDCPVWKREKQIMEIKVKQNVSYPEAKRLLGAQTPSTPSGLTYAMAASPRNQTGSVVTVTMSTQTDITWPESQNEPSNFLPSTSKLSNEISTQTAPSKSSSNKSNSSRSKKSVSLERPGKVVSRGRSGTTNKPQNRGQASPTPGTSERHSTKSNPSKDCPTIISNPFEALSDFSEEEQMELCSSSPRRSPSRKK